MGTDSIFNKVVNRALLEQQQPHIAHLLQASPELAVGVKDGISAAVGMAFGELQACESTPGWTMLSLDFKSAFILKVYVQYSVMCVDKAIVTEVSNQSKCIREHGLKQGEGTRQNKTEGGKWNDRGQEGKWYQSREIAPIYSRWKHTHSGDREWTSTLKTGGSDISNLLGPTDATTRWYSKLVQQDVTQQGGTTSSTRGHTTW